MTDTSAAIAPPEAVERAYDRIARDGRSGIWIELVEREQALAAAVRVQDRVRAGESLPLAGRTLAVKNNIDVHGIRTTAGCSSYGVVPAADAPVVRSLVDAGAVVVGVTNMDQFATGLVGTRSPHGICPNAHWPGLIAGGSSSGSAVAVAADLVDLALGTDTAGSGRVPAAANGIIGVKPTPGRVPTAGVVPACRSFDCVSLFGRDLDLLRTAFATVAEPIGGATTSGRPPRIAQPSPAQLTFDGDEQAEAAYAAGLAGAVRALDGEIVEADLEPFVAAGRLLYAGAFVRERYEAVGPFIDAHPDDIDPVVYGIIHAARDIPEGRLEADRSRLAALRIETESLWSRADVLVLPTVPRVPTVIEVLAEPLSVNSMLGTYTNFVNLLGLCSVTVPIGPPAPEGPPASLMLIAPQGRDETVLALAARLFDPR